MGKRNVGKLLVYGVLLLLPAWPAVQVYDAFHARFEKKDAVHLLYEVSAFQMELLNSLLQDAGRLKETGQLDSLKQALYSASYAHERLISAVGTDQMASLDSLPQLMQYVIRLQLGGERPLKAGEIKALQEAGGLYNELYESYAKLMNTSGEVISSENKKMAEADGKLAELIKKKQL